MKIGHHIDKIYVKSKDMSEQISMAHQIIEKKTGISINTIGIFVLGPKSVKVSVDSDDYDNIKELNMNIFVHNAYISNSWNDKLKQSLHFIHKQLEICEHIKAKGFVVHLPKNNMELVIRVLKLLYDPKLSTKIYLEIPATKPVDSIFEKPETLNELFNSIKHDIDSNLKHFGLCIDTAHLWSSGVDISSYNNAKKWLYNLKINPKNIFIHLNDNVKKLGHAPDIHATLLQGEIWKNYKNDIKNSGLYAFLEYIHIHNIPFIFERSYPEVLKDYLIIIDIFR